MTAKIVVVGSYNRDFVIQSDRLPVLGESVCARSYLESSGGKGSNQAIAAARLGARVHFIGCIGQDAIGDAALALWEQEGVSISVRRAQYSGTGTAFVTVFPDGENTIVVVPGANHELKCDDLALMEESIAESDTLLVQLEIQLNVVVHAIELAKRHGLRIIVNPAPAQPLPTDIYPKIDVLTPNETEARVMAGEQPNSTTSIEYVVSKLKALGVNRVVLTQGKQGALLATGSAGAKRVPAPKVFAKDPTGAGDAFNAALAVGLSEGLPIEQSIAWAGGAGAYCATMVGVLDGLPKRNELDAFMRQKSK